MQQHFILYVFLPIFCCCWLCSDSSWIEHLIRSTLGENEWERCVVGDCRKRDNNSKRFYFQIMPANVDVFAIFSFALCIAVRLRCLRLTLLNRVRAHTRANTQTHMQANRCDRDNSRMVAAAELHLCHDGTAIKTKRDTIKITKPTKTTTMATPNPTEQSVKWLRSERKNLHNKCWL